jgi:hypothetical protein
MTTIATNRTALSTLLQPYTLAKNANAPTIGATVRVKARQHLPVVFLLVFILFSSLLGYQSSGTPHETVAIVRSATRTLWLLFLRELGDLIDNHATLTQLIPQLLYFRVLRIAQCFPASLI